MFTNEDIKISRTGSYLRRSGSEWKTVIKVNCEICGKEVFRRPDQAKKFDTVCSYKCMGIKKQGIIKDKDLYIFDKIGSKNFNYLLGLISTDGYVYDKNNIWFCSITLNDRDLHLLEDIQKLFGGKINAHSKSAYRWILYNKPFVKWLIDNGITRKKSLNMDITDYFASLSIENKYAFLRGVIDGDGCIFKYGFEICGASEVFIKMCLNFFGVGRIYNRGSNVKAVRIYKEAYDCLKFIYNVSDDDLVMHRKLIKYKNIEKRKKQ